MKTNLCIFRYKALSGFFRMFLASAALFLTVRAEGQVIYQNLHTNVLSDGSICGGVVLGSDGAVYGMTADGGSNGVGTVFRVDPLTLNFSLLHTFTTNGTDGHSPIGSVAGNVGYGGPMLIQGRDGALYGVTALGGTTGGGTVFTVNTDGSGYMTVYDITLDPNAFSEYSQPSPCGLIQGQDGMLYVTLFEGGTDQIPDGSVFKVATDGSNYKLLHTMGGSITNGLHPYASVVQARDGMLYGTTEYGGAYAAGVLYKLDTNGLSFTEIYEFGLTASNRYPQTPLMQASDGLLYGTTDGGGAANTGVIFKINTDGSGYTELHEFDNPNGYYHIGRWPGPLVQDNTGLLYGAIDGVTFYTIQTNGSNYTEFNVPIPNSNLTAANDTSYTMGPDGSLYGRLFKLQFALDNYAVTYTFDNDGVDGKSPETPLTQDQDGVLYGITYMGGTNNKGSVFSLGPNGGGYTQIHSFLTNGTDGLLPTALLAGADGALYGATTLGGTNNAGTIFTLNTNGSDYGLLHTFVTNGIDGRGAVGLLQGNDAGLYGITEFGGSNNVGILFKLKTNGASYTVLHTFLTNGVDGQHGSALAQGSDTFLYGITSSGGSNNFGVVFKLNTDGGAYTVLHTFPNNGTDGQLPEVIFQGIDGMLYGICQYGGTNQVGIVFTLDSTGGTYTLLHTFNTGGTDGNYPTGLTQATDGALYGTTLQGGTYNNGTVFQLNPDGSGYAVAHNFDTSINPNDGRSPRGSLWQGEDGALYGTTESGGANNEGIIFRLALNNGHFSSLSLSPNKNFQLAVTGAALNYRIDASTDLMNWVTLAYVTNTAGTFNYIDASASGFPNRFYRMHSSP